MNQRKKVTKVLAETKPLTADPTKITWSGFPTRSVEAPKPKQGIKHGPEGEAINQIRNLSRRLDELAEHIERHPKDGKCKRSYLLLTKKRQKLLNRLPRAVKLKLLQELLD